MKQLILSFILLLCFTITYSHELETIREYSDKSKWIFLKVLLLKYRHFEIVPNDEIEFHRQNVLLSKVYGTKKTLYKRGTWYVDPQNGYIQLKIPYGTVPGFYTRKFYSFDVACNKFRKHEYCSVDLYVGQEYREPVGDDRFDIDKYFQLNLTAP